MAMPKLTLYVDIVSPFGYIAYHIIRHSPTFARCDVTYVPVVLGGIFKECGVTPPIRIKNKDKWIDTERLRWARFFAVPITELIPEGFPSSTLGAQRALCAVSLLSPSDLIPCIDALYRSHWVDGDGYIGRPENFMPVLEKTLKGTTAAEVLKASTEPRVKELLTSNTGRALKSGSFGLPWFECTNANGETEGFWGVDHLGLVTKFLGLDRKLDKGFGSLL